MFNIGPLELMVLAIVGLVVLGPDRLPGLARDAANMLRTLRELATGARQQLHDELGPEFADMDLRNLNPRTAVQRAVFGDDFDFGKLDPRAAARDAILGDEDLRAADPRSMLRDDEDDRRPSRNGHAADKPISMSKPVGQPPAASRPRPRPRPSNAPYDSDAT